jgi:hypothetical protein
MNSFIVAESQAHGLGLFATRDIPCESTIFEENPCLVLSRSQMADEGKLLSLLDNLTEDDRAAVLSLFGNKVSEKCFMNATPIIDASDTFGMHRNRRNFGIYLKCARLNHSCSPNATRASNPGEHNMSVCAIKLIKAGEEITISYLSDNLLSAKDRRKALKSNDVTGTALSEGCKCTVCIKSSAFLAKSDARRIKLASLQIRLLQDQLSPHEVQEFIQSMDKEELSLPLLSVQASFALMRAMTTRHFMGFRIGDTVKLQNLQVKPDLNSATGKVISALDSTTGRIGIQLEFFADGTLQPDRKIIAVKPNNLIFVRASF